MRILLDTNILLRLFDAASIDHAVVVQALESIMASSTREPVIFPQVLTEFWSVATRPRESNGPGLSPEAAFGHVNELRTGIDLLTDPEGWFEVWLESVRRLRIVGRRDHDLRLAASAITSGIPELLTINVGDFAGIDRLRVLHPRELPVGIA